MIPVTTTSARRTLVIAFSTAVAAAVATGACGSDEPAFRGPIDSDTYVTVMAELADLQRFPPSGPGEAARAQRADSARQAILDRHGVTADELLEFAEAAGARPDLMVELTDRIAVLSDTLAQRRTGRGEAARPPSDTAAASDSDTASGRGGETTDSTPAAAIDRPSFRERAREFRGRPDAEREPSP